MTLRSSVASFFKRYLSEGNSWVLLVTVLAGLSYYFAFDFLRWNQFDSLSYEVGSHNIFGLEEGEDIQGRLSKPIALFLPGFFEWTCGFPSKYGFVIQSGLCFFIMIFLWKGILRNLNFSEEIQKTGVIMLLLCQPLAVYSFGFLTDFPGWCCMLWLLYTYTAEKQKIRWLKIAIITFIGLLVKESIFVAIFFIIINELFINAKIDHKTVFIILLIILIVLLSQFFIYLLNFGGLIKRQTEILNWGSVFEIQETYQLIQIWRSFETLWWFFLVPFIFQYKEVKSNRLIRNALLTFVICISIIPFVHPAFLVDRVLFMFFPLLLIPTLALLNFYPPIKMRWLIISNGMLSIISTWLTYRFVLEDVFLIYFIISLIFPILIIVFFHPNNRLESESTV